MGAWGHDAFANDTALDWAPTLTDRPSVVNGVLGLINAEVNDHYPLAGEEFAIAFAAATIIAYARTSTTRYQSIGTTLFAQATDDFEEEALVPYLPEENRAFVETATAEFTDKDVQFALQALDILSANTETEGWDDTEARERAIDKIRQMLSSSLSPA